MGKRIKNQKAVADLFDAEVLAWCCEADDFSDYADKTELGGGKDRFYWHADNGADILAVAHLDTVQSDRSCKVTETAGGLVAHSGALDDRLGVYTIMDLLPKMGINVDLLFTTDEEIGASTAMEFDTDKDYNWIIEFDRMGTDVVTYDFESAEWDSAIRNSGARVGVGIFSDICELEHLGCKAANWGIGYQDYHSTRSHAWLDDTFRMVSYFGTFYQQNARKFWGHKPLPRSWGNSDYNSSLSEIATGLSVANGDCGHKVDYNDPATYVFDHADNLILCNGCGAV